MKQTSRAVLREHLAATQHEIWSHWMMYLFSASVDRKDGAVVIPARFVARWREQMKTHYVLLSKQERESDLSQADKILTVLEEHAIAHRLMKGDRNGTRKDSEGNART